MNVISLWSIVDPILLVIMVWTGKHRGLFARTYLKKTIRNHETNILSAKVQLFRLTLRRSWWKKNHWVELSPIPSYSQSCCYVRNVDHSVKRILMLDLNFHPSNLRRVVIPTNRLELTRMQPKILKCTEKHVLPDVCDLCKRWCEMTSAITWFENTCDFILWD